MMKTRLLIPIAIVIAIVFSGFASTLAQQTNYQRVVVGNRVSLAIPNHWRVLNEDDRRNLAAAAETSGAPAHVAALAVNATPAPTGAMIRVSILPDDLTQSDVRDALKRDRAGTMRQVAAEMDEQLLLMDAQLNQQGMNILGKASATIDSIGGQVAFAMTYRRTSGTAGESPFTVTQFHIPLGATKVLITLSFRESTALVYSLILEHVKKSITIN